MEKHLERIAVADLIPYENNPRYNGDAVDAVIESMRQCENIDPIEIDENNVILSGHTRRLALMQLGETETDVLRVSGLSEEQKKKYRLLANKTNELAEWDRDKLLIELEDLDFEGFDFGFDVWTDPGTPTEIIEDDPPEPTEDPPYTVQGDIWTLGHHRLMCGDSASAADMRRLMDGALADLCITEPPEATASFARTEQGKHVSADAAYRGFLVDAFRQIRESLRPGGSFYIVHDDVQGLNTRVACEQSLGKVRQCLIWNQNSIKLGRQDYQQQHTPILYGWTEGAEHYFTPDKTIATVIDDDLDIDSLKKDAMKKLLHKILDGVLPTTVIAEDRPKSSALHAAMLPVRLLARLVRNSSKAGHIVLDVFGGTGSTMITCEQLGRRCFTMEIDPKTVDVIVERYFQFAGAADDITVLRDGKEYTYEEISTGTWEDAV